MPSRRPRVKSERSFYNGDVPRVSNDHLAARRQQILDAARACFLRNGFHQSTMQDVIREADLSVGAVYRYFPSKNDLIIALSEQVIAEVSGVFESLTAAEPAPPLAAVMVRAVEVVTAETEPHGTLRLALQIWSESLHDPALAEFVRGVYERLRAILITVARQAQSRGELPADADPEAVGSVLFALMPGYGLQRILTGRPSPELYTAGLRTILTPRRS